jgi:uncharacterized membrane protein YhaH (DUF805 family)
MRRLTDRQASRVLELLLVVVAIGLIALWPQLLIVTIVIGLLIVFAAGILSLSSSVRFRRSSHDDGESRW